MKPNEKSSSRRNPHPRRTRPPSGRQPFRQPAQPGRFGDRNPVHRDPQAAIVPAARRCSEKYQELRLAHSHQRQWRRSHVGARPQTVASPRRHLKHLQIAAIGPATKKAIVKHGLKVKMVPEEYVAESVVKGLRDKVNGQARRAHPGQSRARRDSRGTARGRSRRSMWSKPTKP